MIDEQEARRLQEELMERMRRAQFAPGKNAVYDKQMADDITRPELDAKLEAVEARMDARITRIEAVGESIQHETRSIKAWVMASIVAVILTGFAATVAVILGVTANQNALGQLVTSAFQQGQQSTAKK